MLQTFLARRAFKGHFEHSKETPRVLGHSTHSGTRKVLEHSGTQGTWEFERYLNTRVIKAFGNSKGTWTLGYSRHLGIEKYLNTRVLKALGNRKVLKHSGTQGTWELERYLNTQVLKAPGTRRALVDSGTWTLEHSRHFICQTPFTVCQIIILSVFCLDGCNLYFNL